MNLYKFDPRTLIASPLEEIPQAKTFWYLASPYSKHPAGLEEAFREVCRASAQLLKAGHSIFSPIAHTHPIAIYGNMDPLNHDIWLKADRCTMDAASGILILAVPGWEDSYGIQFERGVFKTAGKPELYVNFAA